MPRRLSALAGAAAVLLAAAAPAPAAAPCPACPDLVEVPPLPGGRPFALTRTEVTFDQWAACVADGACRGGQDDHGWGRGARPVINVTWDDAAAFAGWLGTRVGRLCRLPTEAEWEHAARAGTATAFWWGEQAGRGHANCRDCLGPEPPYGTRPAASFPANPWGLFEMNGNVWEWTADCWTPEQSPCGARVIKGGSWYYFSGMSKAGARARNDPRLWSYNIGVRVLCEAP